jgi:2-dehydropantoate 2-reductase
MRYVIVGAGAIGGSIGARLFQGGHEVVLVARGAHLDVVRDRGLRLLTPEADITLAVPAVAGPRELTLRADDVLIISTKLQDAAAALDDWAWQPVAGGGVAAHDLPVLCAQNGVAGERLALRRFRHVYGVYVWLPATHLEPGVVEAQGTPLTGVLQLGRYPVHTGDDDAGQRIAAGLAASTFLAPVSAEVMRFKYGKLLGNLANAIDAVLDSGARDGALTAAADGLRDRARAEGAAVLKAAGIGFADEAEQAALRGDGIQVEPVVGRTSRAGSSSWQSLTRGTGSIEAGYLNGEITLLAREHGLTAPVNERLQRLASQFAAARRAPGSITAAELADLTAGR